MSSFELVNPLKIIFKGPQSLLSSKKVKLGMGQQSNNKGDL